MMYLSNIVRPKSDPKVVRTGASSLDFSDRLARTLGWLSLGLGLVELLAPRRVTRSLGLQGREGLVRAYGAREIGAGLVSLSVDKKAGLWSRVAGDGLDIVTLLPALRDDNPKRNNVVLALTAVVGIALVDLIAANASMLRHKENSGQRRLYRDRSGFPQGLNVARDNARLLKGTPAHTLAHASR
jgi:hypothetical protein